MTSVRNFYYLFRLPPSSRKGSVPFYTHVFVPRSFVFSGTSFRSTHLVSYLFPSSPSRPFVPWVTLSEHTVRSRPSTRLVLFLPKCKVSFGLVCDPVVSSHGPDGFVPLSTRRDNRLTYGAQSHGTHRLSSHLALFFRPQVRDFRGESRFGKRKTPGRPIGRSPLFGTCLKCRLGSRSPFGIF